LRGSRQFLLKAKFMNESNTALAVRRSSRVPVSLPILVTSLDPKAQFSEVCETMVVSAHGCAMRSKTKVDTGVRLRFRSREGRDTTAQVVYCRPIGVENQGWMLGARLEQPDNFWGVRNCPKDWVAAAVPSGTVSTPAVRTLTPAVSRARKQEPEPNNGASQLAEEMVKHLIAESVRPLQAEVTAIREKLQRREGNPSRLEVSLASIPAELQQQLEVRLRNGLEPKIVEEVRQRSAQLLAEAGNAIGNKTKEAQENFSRRLSDEHRALEQRGQEIAKQISAGTQERLRASSLEFERKLEDGGNRLKRLSQELLEFLQSSLNDEHNARRGELEELRATFAAESERFHQQTENLSGRIGKLDESVRSLESGLDERLSLMCSRTIRETRSELESVAGAIVSDATSRGTESLEKELNQSCDKIKAVQIQTVASVTESLDRKAQDALLAFEKSMDSLAKVSVERWRMKLATALGALAKNFGEEFQSE
jgi:hypothetical protein